MRQNAAGFQPIPGERHLDGDVAGDLGKALAFRDHGVGFESRDLGAYRPLDNRADLLDDITEIAAGFRHKRRIGGDTVEKPGCGDVPNFRDIGGIDKKLHVFNPFRLSHIQ